MEALLQIGIWQQTQSPTFKELAENCTVIAGSVVTVIEKLTYYTDTLHAGMLVTGGHVGEIPDYLVLKNQEMMAKEVMPHFRKQAGTPEEYPFEIKTVQEKI